MGHFVATKKMIKFKYPCTRTQLNENKVSSDDRLKFWVADEISLFLIQDLLMPRQHDPREPCGLILSHSQPINNLFILFACKFCRF